MDCIFCKIVKGEIPSNKVYEDDTVYAFYDINPIAPVHILIIPKEHIKSMCEMEEKHENLVGHILFVAHKIAQEQGFADDGYRIINNCGENAGQTVMHMHYHLLAGQKFSWGKMD